VASGNVLDLCSYEGDTVPKEPSEQGYKLRPSVAKKPYQTPRLIEYGHISQLTAGTTGSSTDKGTLSNHHGMG
jgi:hypothetical protein